MLKVTLTCYFVEVLVDISQAKKNKVRLFHAVLYKTEELVCEPHQISRNQETEQYNE